MSATFTTLAIGWSLSLWDRVTGGANLGEGIETKLDPPNKKLTFTSGTGDYECDKDYQASGTVGTSGTTLDLAGTLTHPIDGSVVSFAEVAYIEIWNTSAKGAGNLIIGGAASNQFLLFGAGAHTLLLGPGGKFRIYAPYDGGGWPVAAGTGDNFKLAASTGNVDYKLVIAGRSA